MIRTWLGNCLIKRKLRKHLNGCNYEIAKIILIGKFSGGVFPNELIHLFDGFVAKPCFDKAFDLIKFDSKFLDVFELAKSDLLSESSITKGDVK